MSSSGEEEHSASTPSVSSPVQSPEASLDGTTSKSVFDDPKNPGSDQEHLLYAFGRLSVRKDLPMAERMFILLQDVFQSAVETHNLDLGLRDWRDDLRRADGNSRRGIRDVEFLKWIRNVLDQLHLEALESFTLAANILADGSRDGMAKSHYRISRKNLTHGSIVEAAIWTIWHFGAISTNINRSRFRGQ